MDELIAFVRSLLLADSGIQGIFTASGRPIVIVRSPGGASDAVYPVIIIDALPGGDITQGEGYPRFSEGSLKLYIVARRSDVAASPARLVWDISNRIQDIIRGNRHAGLLPLQGRATGTKYKCVICRNVLPSGPVSDPDPEVSRFVLTYKIFLLRSSLTS